VATFHVPSRELEDDPEDAAAPDGLADGDVAAADASRTWRY